MSLIPQDVEIDGEHFDELQWLIETYPRSAFQLLNKHLNTLGLYISFDLLKGGDAT